MQNNINIAESRKSKQAFEPYVNITSATKEADMASQWVQVELELVSTTTTSSEYDVTVTNAENGETASVTGTMDSYESTTTTVPYDSQGDILIEAEGTITQTQDFSVFDDYLVPGTSEEFSLDKISFNSVDAPTQADPGSTMAVSYEVQSDHGVPVYVDIDVEVNGVVEDPFTTYVPANGTDSDTRNVPMPSDASGNVEVCCVEVGGRTTN
jgi:hypothetical protein